MSRSPWAITLAQGALVAALASAVVQALDAGQAAPLAVTTPTATAYVYPTCIGARAGTREPSVPCVYPDRRSPDVQTATAVAWATRVVTLGPTMTVEAAWMATEVAEVKAGQTPTLCPVPPTRIAWGYPGDEDARCFRGFADATATAEIESGEVYGIRTEWGPEGYSPDRTPTVTTFGTVPPHAAAIWTAQALEGAVDGD